MDPLLDFKAFSFAGPGGERTVYRKGEGPAVIVMHEVPGISSEVARFARKVDVSGFTVFMPHLFGVFGTRTNELNRVRELARLCISREWHGRHGTGCSRPASASRGISEADVRLGR